MCVRDTGGVPPAALVGALAVSRVMLPAWRWCAAMHCVRNEWLTPDAAATGVLVHPHSTLLATCWCYNCTSGGTYCSWRQCVCSGHKTKQPDMPFDTQPMPAHPCRAISVPLKGSQHQPAAEGTPAC
jgi:hypothetical protein